MVVSVSSIIKVLNSSVGDMIRGFAEGLVSAFAAVLLFFGLAGVVFFLATDFLTGFFFTGFLCAAGFFAFFAKGFFFPLAGEGFDFFAAFFFLVAIIQ